jgi:hypothetical protein
VSEVLAFLFPEGGVKILQRTSTIKYTPRNGVWQNGNSDDRSMYFFILIFSSSLLW